MAMYRLSLKQHTHCPTKASAAQQAAYIMRDLETPETKAYVEYVLRQSRKTQDREDLVHAEWHHLPGFAQDKPVAFFAACDQWTCSGNSGHMWEEISSHLEAEGNESGCPKTRESELLLNGPLQARPPSKGALLDLEPLSIVEFDQLKLRRSELRTIQGRMTDLMQPALVTIIRTAILCQERLPIGDLELSVGDPDRHALP